MEVLPPAVSAYLQADCLRERAPAYLLVDRGGRLSRVGGHYAHYGLPDVRPGDAVEDKADFLTGLLPANDAPVHIPLIHLGQERYADVHVFSAPEGDWVLLLDASREARRLESLQQKAHEVTLLRRRQARMRSQVNDLRKMLADKARFQDLLGRSAGMLRVFQLIRDVAGVDATVLIRGETGTGKELAARAIHALSRRKAGPFVVMNCAGLSDSLINSQLFGHRKGAFTDAARDQVGLFEAADGGTILLDEIGDIPMNTQTRILRVLEQKEVLRIGDTEPRRVDIRILAATHRDLGRLVEREQFREDLLYRIRVARIDLPALRARREDIPLLTEAFLHRAAAAAGKPVDAVSPDAMRALMDYAWPGNVRELKNAIEFAVIRCRGAGVEAEDLPPEITDRPLTPPPRQEQDPASERERIRDALRRTGGRREEAARLLGISRATLYRRMKALEKT
ncbi:MAG: sigma 54-interacting transcriptional regulator [Lentisphaerae bacterium]|nr:sigma 54-interacting transcriptional regulator [Lentisphaerota bacterium]